MANSTRAEKLRIGLVSSTGVVLGGGQPTTFGYLAQGLQKLGHHVVLFNPGPPADDFLGVEIHNLNR